MAQGTLEQPGSLSVSSGPYEPLRQIMRRFGARCDPATFYWEVTKAYHAAESQVYDVLHEGLFTGCAPMWRRLLGHAGRGPLGVIDVGAGTGAVGHYLARLAPDQVRALTVVDPSTAMLEQCRRKAAGWPFPVEFVEGDIQAVSGRRADIVTASSVLHHVVDLAGFAAKLREVLPPGGLLLTMADPRAGSRDDPVLRRRMAKARWRRPIASALELGAAVLGAVGRRPRTKLADATNASLLARGIVERPIDAATIYAVTDFHVPGQPGGLGLGFALDALRELFAELELVDSLTYEFHGIPWHRLRASERSMEETWFERKDAHGALFGSAWRRV